jgi:hypothetical protein
MSTAVTEIMFYRRIDKKPVIKPVTLRELFLGVLRSVFVVLWRSGPTGMCTSLTKVWFEYFYYAAGHPNRVKMWIPMTIARICSALSSLFAIFFATCTGQFLRFGEDWREVLNFHQVELVGRGCSLFRFPLFSYFSSKVYEFAATQELRGRISPLAFVLIILWAIDLPEVSVEQRNKLLHYMNKHAWKYGGSLPPHILQRLWEFFHRYDSEFPDTVQDEEFFQISLLPVPGVQEVSPWLLEDSLLPRGSSF